MRISSYLIGAIVITITILAWFAVIFGYIYPKYGTKDETAFIEVSVGFGGLIVVEGVSFFMGQVMESKRHKEDQKERHANILLNEIYTILLQAEVYQEHDSKKCWLGFNRTQLIDGKPVYFGAMNIEELKQGVKYGWAMKHLEDKQYKKAYQLWNEIQTKIDLYNSNIQPFDQNLENTIKQEMKNSFPSFEASEEISDISNLYSLHRMKQILFNAIGDTMYEFPSFIIDRDSHSTRCITSVGGMINPILRCPERNENELSVNKFNQVLNNIRNNQDLVKQHPIQTRKAIDDTLSSFKSELKIIVEKLEAFQPLAGKCDGCP